MLRHLVFLIDIINKKNIRSCKFHEGDSWCRTGCRTGAGRSGTGAGWVPDGCQMGAGSSGTGAGWTFLLITSFIIVRFWSTFFCLKALDLLFLMVVQHHPAPNTIQHHLAPNIIQQHPLIILLALMLVLALVSCSRLHHPAPVRHHPAPNTIQHHLAPNIIQHHPLIILLVLALVSC